MNVFGESPDWGGGEKRYVGSGETRLFYVCRGIDRSTASLATKGPLILNRHTSTTNDSKKYENRHTKIFLLTKTSMMKNIWKIFLRKNINFLLDFRFENKQLNNTFKCFNGKKFLLFFFIESNCTTQRKNTSSPLLGWEAGQLRQADKIG